MTAKRKESESGGGHSSRAKTKKIRQQKTGNFSDDEDLSDIEECEVFNGIRIPVEGPPIVSAENNPGPRMVIKNIVANNFKSYYGKVDIGPFHKVFWLGLQYLNCMIYVHIELVNIYYIDIYISEE